MDYTESYLKNLLESFMSKYHDSDVLNNWKNNYLESLVYVTLRSRTKTDIEDVELNAKIQLKDKLYIPDIYTKTGIEKLRIPPYSCFELKINPISDSLYRAKELATKLKEEHPQGKLFFIYEGKGELTNKVLNEAKKDKSIEIYELSSFLSHIKRIKEINDKIEILEQSWHKKRDLNLTRARASYQDNNCSLFLGAGVSMSAGGPSWENLLFKAIKKNRNQFTKRDFKKIFVSCGQSPIVMGRYIIPDQNDLEHVTNYLQQYVLYKKTDIEKSDLISSICEFVETNKVESIITYNFDDLIETAIEQRGKKRAFSVVAKSRNTKDEIPVYHVHGLIPHSKSGMASTPVLSEKDYHDIYRESFHWSNIEQLHALDRNSCFFIGLSLTDPNLRRLLDFSNAGNNNERHHYAFIKRDALYSNYDVEKNIKHFDTLEKQLESVGVWVIWYENYEELPTLIRTIISEESVE